MLAIQDLPPEIFDRIIDWIIPRHWNGYRDLKGRLSARLVCKWFDFVISDHAIHKIDRIALADELEKWQEVPYSFLAWLLYRKIISPRPVYSCSDHKPASSSMDTQTPVLVDDSSLVISSMEENLYLQRACYLAVSALGAHKAYRHLACSTGEEVKQQMLSDKLAMSAYCGHAEDVKSILAQGFKIDPQGGILGSPLCAAAAGNHKEIVTFLLEQGLSPNNHRKGGPTALWISCLNGYHQMVQLLLLCPTIKVNIRHGNKTPFAIAAEKGHMVIMRILLDTSDVHVDFEERGCPLMCATMGNQGSALHFLVGELLLSSNSNDVYEYCTDLLWEAVDGNKVSAVRALLQYPEVDPNRLGFVTDGDEEYEAFPLWNAVVRGYHEVVYELLQRSDIAAHQEGFDSVLLIAISQPDEQTVELLLDCKAVDPNAESPLVLAVKEGEVRVVELFLRRPDTDVNLFDRSGDSALSFACEWGDEEILRLLLSRDDLDLKQKNNQGQTALWLAAGQGNEKIVRLLLERDRSLTNVPESGDITPLMEAACYGHLAVVEVLLELGADVTLKDYQGRTALSLAEKNGFVSIAERLLACQKE